MVLQHPFARSAHQLALLARFLLVGQVWRWQASFSLLGLDASGLAPWGLWLSGHKPPSPV